jgi:hypothetical protein
VAATPRWKALWRATWVGQYEGPLGLEGPPDGLCDDSVVRPEISIINFARSQPVRFRPSPSVHRSKQSNEPPQTCPARAGRVKPRTLVGLPSLVLVIQKRGPSACNLTEPLSSTLSKKAGKCLAAFRMELSFLGKVSSSQRCLRNREGTCRNGKSAAGSQAGRARSFLSFANKGSVVGPVNCPAILIPSGTLCSSQQASAAR